MRSILSNRLLMCLLILLICAVAGFYLLQMQQPKAPIVISKPVEVEPPKETAPPVGDTSQGGHYHGDEWHADPHETHDPPAVSTGQSYIPEGAAVSPDFPPVDPNEDPIEAAYKRLEYIKNNPYAWGGVHSERATELIAVLMPPPEPVDHDDGDELSNLMYELIQQGDPRAAEAIAGLLSSTYQGLTADSDALVAIGPPAVPYILPYLEREDTMGSDWIYVKGGVFDSLSRIGVRYRADLGSIVDHLIIPKLEVIAADEENKRYGRSTVMKAKKALVLLGR